VQNMEQLHAHGHHQKTEHIIISGHRICHKITHTHNTGIVDQAQLKESSLYGCCTLV